MELEDIVRFVEQSVTEYDGSHDLAHALRVAENVQRICSDKNKKRLHLSVVAALTHDTCDSKYVDKSAACDKLLRFLRTRMSLSDATDVVDVVQNISYTNLRTTGPPLKLTKCGMEIWKVVSDADLIEAIGMIGIIRTIVYQGSMHKSLNEAIVYMEQSLLRCIPYIQNETALVEARRRCSVMHCIVQQMKEKNGAWWNFAHFLLSKGMQRDPFDSIITELEAKRWLPREVMDELSKETCWRTCEKFREE